MTEEIIRVRQGEGIPDEFKVVRVLHETMEVVGSGTSTERVYTVLVERQALTGEVKPATQAEHRRETAAYYEGGDR